MRIVFDNLFQGEGVMSHAVLYGFITLVFAFVISIFGESQDSD